MQAGEPPCSTSYDATRLASRERSRQAKNIRIPRGPCPATSSCSCGSQIDKKVSVLAFGGKCAHFLSIVTLLHHKKQGP